MLHCVTASDGCASDDAEGAAVTGSGPEKSGPEGLEEEEGRAHLEERGECDLRGGGELERRISREQLLRQDWTAAAASRLICNQNTVTRRRSTSV